MDDKDAAYMGGVFALVRVSSGCRFETVKNGKIDVFCTLGQENLSFLARYRRNVRSDSLFWQNRHIFVRFELEKRCRRVHFGDILPESCFPTAQAYKICASCHDVSGAFAQDSRRRTYAPYLSSPASGDGAALWPALARSIVAARSRKRSKGGYIARLQ